MTHILLELMVWKVFAFALSLLKLSNIWTDLNLMNCLSTYFRLAVAFDKLSDWVFSGFSQNVMVVFPCSCSVHVYQPKSLLCTKVGQSDMYNISCGNFILHPLKYCADQIVLYAAWPYLAYLVQLCFLQPKLKVSSHRAWCMCQFCIQT